MAGAARQLPAAAAGLRRAGGGAPGGGGSPGPGGQSARLAERAAAGHRPGPGRVRRAPAEQPVAPLAAAAGAGLGLWLVLQWGFTLVQAWQLQREGDRYAAQSAELYRQLFPEDRKLINLRAQFDQHLADSASSGGEGQLLGLLGQAATVIGGEPTVSVEQLDFSAARGDVALQVRAPGFDVLERLRSRLSESGLAVQLGSASRDGSTVSARLVIGG
ncbi:type II secretion system protein GspL [Acinetobacter baumannii]